MHLVDLCVTQDDIGWIVGNTFLLPFDGRDSGTSSARYPVLIGAVHAHVA